MGRSSAARTIRLMGVTPTARHIVVIPSWYSSGRGSGGGYFRDQALAMQAAGHRVAILAPDIHTRRDLRAGRAIIGRDAVIEDDGIAVYRATRRIVMPRLPYRNALAWSLCGLSLFRTYVGRHGLPDLVHAHSCLNAGVLAMLIKRRHGIPFILSEHSAGFAAGRLRWWERDLVGRVIRRADGLIAVSPHLGALLERQFPPSSWAYVPNILGEAFLAPPAAATAARRGDFVFLCAARLSAEKNHALLIAAFADAFAGEPNTHLRLAGAGPMEPQLRRLSADLRIAGRVEFLGTLDAAGLRAAMEAADAFVLASDSETFGVVVIEAQATGLPVVSTASGGPDHLVTAKNGLLVPARDRAALRDALLRMRRDAENFDRTQIRADAIERFGPATFVRRFDEIAAL